MKKFFHDYSYSVVKMFVDQFAIAIFGTSLTFATSHAHGNSTEFDSFTLIVNICSAIFYLFLLYTLTWEIGAKDRVAVDSGKKPYRPHLGLLLSLLANIPNLILACLYALATLFQNLSVFGEAGMNQMKFIVRFIASLLQGMYFGTITTVSVPYGDRWVQIAELWPTYFLMVVPALLTCWLAYYLGFKNFRFINTNQNKPTPTERPNMK